MKGPEISLKHLQRAITMELTTVNQYLLQAHQLANWGIDRLANRMFEEVEEERGPPPISSSACCSSTVSPTSVTSTRS